MIQTNVVHYNKVYCICNSCKYVTFKDNNYVCKKENKIIWNKNDYAQDCKWWPPVVVLKEEENNNDIIYYSKWSF